MLNFPLVFRETGKEKVWNGDRLRHIAGKDFPENLKIGESWEISDVDGDVSIVRQGPMNGRSLRELHQEHGKELLGEDLAERYPDRFPLLIKLLDTSAALSVQVHPSDEDVKRLHLKGAGKMEAWYILHAEPGATMVHGLVPGMTRLKFEELLATRRIEEALRCFLVKKGDTIFCPPGTVHAIGAGLTLFEIQQTSDTTYRLYDWDRPQDPDKPRPLHINESLAVMNFGPQPPMRQHPELIHAANPRREIMVSCDKFDIERWRISTKQAIEGFAGIMEILCVTDGYGTVEAGGESVQIRRGSTVLVPATADEWKVSPRGGLELLHVTVPAE